MRSDDQLVALFRMGNDEAFRVIHDRYRQRLFAYTRQMLSGARSDAEDALQDVFLRAYHALRADDRPVTLRAWLYRVAHNRCVDHLRRAGTPVVNVVELFESVRSLHDPLEEAQRREDLRRLVADVRRLPEQQRSALLMREMEGLTYQELADALEVTVPAVKSLLVRARMGLVDAQDARDTACVDIRDDLDSAHDRGVRASGRARRHLRECSGCRDYRASLKGLSTGLSALQPGPAPWTLIAKIFGIGGAGSGAAAGGSAAVGGSAAATSTIAVGSGVTAVTATKVAAVVCCAALVGGGAAEVEHASAPPAKHRVAKAAPAVAPIGLTSTHPHAGIPAVLDDRLVNAHHQAAKRRATVMRAGAPGGAGARAHGLGAADPQDAADPAAASAGGVQAPDEPLDPLVQDPSADPTSATGTATSGTADPGSGSATTGSSGAAPGTPGTSASATTSASSPGSTGGAAAPGSTGTGASTTPSPSGQSSGPLAQGASVVPAP